mmetsp:Transcript_11076/g.26128  ORF Transcript_11076/g.26128 Transcript_11076/m.26128 type:complete len:89 (+) Transcript_11076:184-450(+)
MIQLDMFRVVIAVPVSNDSCESVDEKKLGRSLPRLFERNKGRFRLLGWKRRQKNSSVEFIIHSKPPEMISTRARSKTVFDSLLWLVLG